jgi:hypothetical protein
MGSRVSRIEVLANEEPAIFLRQPLRLVDGSDCAFVGRR